MVYVIIRWIGTRKIAFCQCDQKFLVDFDMGGLHSLSLSAEVRSKETAPRESFRARYPADVPASIVRTSQVKTFGESLKSLEN